MSHKRKFNFGKFIDHESKIIGRTATNVTKSVVSVPKSLIHEGAGVLNNLSLPLLLVGGVVVYMVVMKK